MSERTVCCSAYPHQEVEFNLDNDSLGTPRSTWSSKLQYLHVTMQYKIPDSSNLTDELLLPGQIKNVIHGLLSEPRLKYLQPWATSKHCIHTA